MENVLFFSRSNRPKVVFAPSSSGFAPVYEERITKDGVLSLVKVGEHNINDFVQASLESTKVYNILEKFQLGDTSVLERVKGFYADVTEVPTSLVDAHNLFSRISKNFDSLPVEVKEKFGNSVDRFVSSIENGEFQQIITALSSGSAAASQDQIEQIAQKKGDDNNVA